MNTISKFGSLFGALAFSLLALVCLAAPNAHAQAITPGAGSGGGATKQGADFDPAEHLAVSGLLRMKQEGDKKQEGEPDNVVGTLAAAKDTYFLTCSSDKLIAQLKLRDGKKVAIEGKIDEKTKVLSVGKITDGVLPPTEMRNPRGL